MDRAWKLALVGLLVTACAPWGGCADPEVKPDKKVVEATDPAQIKAPPPAPEPPPVDWRTLSKGGFWEPVVLSKRKTPYHILDIDADDTHVVVATFGRGIFLSPDGGKKWRNFDKPRKRSKRRRRNVNPNEPGKALKSNYLSGVDLIGTDLWVRSIGHGFGVMALRDRTWRWWSSRQLKKEFLFPTELVQQGRIKTIATADGLWETVNNGRSFTKKGAQDGLPSEYLLSYAVVGKDGPDALEGQWMGLLNGLYHQAPVRPTRTLTTANGLPDDRIDGIHIEGSRLIVRTPKGLGISDDAGESWRVVGERQGLPAGQIYDVTMWRGGLWVGTAAGLAQVDPATGKVQAVFRNGESPLRNQINVLQVDRADNLLVGTSDGLWRVTPGSQNAVVGQEGACQVDGSSRQTQHPKWIRPIGEGFNRFIDQTYMFGQTWGGQFGVHKGVEFNNAEGTEVRAVARGQVVYADKRPSGANVVIVRHDERYSGRYVYSLYVHLSAFLTQVGTRVEAGTRIGRVGHTGPATNDHLHFEVRLSMEPGDGLKDAISVNPALFLESLPGRGIIAGTVRNKGKRIKGAQVYGPMVPEPQETPFGFFEAYGKNVSPDPVLDEDFAVLDVPPGVYPLTVTIKNKTATACVKVEPGKIAWAEFEF